MARSTSEVSKASKDLKALCTKVRALLVKAERNDIRARFKVAAIIRGVMASAKYGENAVSQMEEILGLDQRTMYRAARVSEVWSASEVKELAGALNSKKLALSWSHLELLAGIVDGRTRRSMVERTLRESLTVRQLRAEIQAAREGASADEAGVEKAPLRGPELVAEVRRCIGSVEKDIESWSKDLLSDVAGSRATLAEADLAELKASAERMNGIAQALWDLSKHLQIALEETPKAMAEVHELKPVSQATSVASM